MPKICLDAGHNNSGADTGAQGNGLREELLTLDICQRLKSLLQFNGIEVVMTREGDFVNGAHGTVNESLKTRCYIANKNQVNLFVSVHINAGGGTGQEIFICGRGGQAERAANILLPYLVLAGGWPNRGVKVAGQYVLENTNMPAILTENGFIDTVADAAKLADPNFRQALAVAHAKGICDYFNQAYKDNTDPVPTVTKTPIIGKETVTIEHCRQFICKVNPNAPDIIPFYQKYGEILGIRWGYAVAQMIKETNYLRFGGDVKPEQNNYAGIGAVGGGVTGAAFAVPEQGVIAHLEHLYAYASTSALPVSLPKVDPRFGLVSRGIAPNWEDLNGRWAVPGVGYGEDIIKIYNKIRGEVVKGGNNVPEHVIVFWTAKDYSGAVMISERLDNCLMTCRNAEPDLNPDAKTAKHLIVVGGPEVTDHPNVTNLCGATGPDTAILAANYAKSL
jgi:N-acetylmuramoyl-L-alanine amidase